ncbi:MAG: hypothetical protein AB1Z57_07300 [Acidimicrobiia bacterium]
MRLKLEVGVLTAAVVLGSITSGMAFEPGDMNCDGVVDEFDCPVMALAMTDPDGYAATYPTCPVENADLNGDGLIDCVDFPLFVAVVGQTSANGCGFMDCPLQPDAIFAVGDGPGPDYEPAVACSESSTTCLVVWQTDPSNISFSIWGRFVGLDGIAFGAPFQISTEATVHESPDVGYDPVRNRFLVAWSSEYAPNPIDTDIRARFIPMGGPDPTELPFPISTTTDRQTAPRLAYAPGADEFLVVWTSDDQTNPNTIVGRRVLADGSGFATGDLTLSQGTQHRIGPALAWDDANSRYILAYNRIESATGADVWLRRISWSGAQIGVETGIAAWPGAEEFVSVDVLDGAPLVTWVGGNRAYARWADSDGLPVGPPLDLTDGAIGSTGETSVACGGAGGGCRAVWMWVDAGGGAWNIVDRRVSSTGGLGPIADVRRSPPGFPLSAFAQEVTVANGSFVRVWTQANPAGSGLNTFDIHARVFQTLLFRDGFESGDTLWWSATFP